MLCLHCESELVNLSSKCSIYFFRESYSRHVCCFLVVLFATRDLPLLLSRAATDATVAAFTLIVEVTIGR